MNKTLSNIFYVFGADLIVKVVSTSTTFLVARLLSPPQYGTWITLMLVVSYAPIASLGTVETLLKQYPFHAGRGDTAAASRIESGVLGSILIAAVVLLVGGFAAARVLNVIFPGITLRLARLMLATAAVSFLSAYFYYRFSARQNFRSVGMIDAGRALTTFAFLVGLTWLWALEGTVVGLLIAELVVCTVAGWSCVRQCGRVVPSFDLTLIGDIVRIGLPITVIWWVFIIQSSADRVISMSLLGESATGYYGLGVSIVSLVILLPVTISRVLYPRVNEKIGQTLREQDLRSLVMLPSHVLSVLIPATIGLLVIGAPIVYRQLLPKYGPGLASAQILLLGSFFMCIVRTGANFLIATNRQRAVLKYILVSLTVNVVLNITLARSGYGIAGIAFGSSVSACVLATLVWFAVFKHLGATPRTSVKEVAGLYLPYGLMLLVLAICAAIAPRSLTESGPHLAALGAAFLVSFAMMMYAIPAIRDRSLQTAGLVRAHFAAKACARRAAAASRGDGGKPFRSTSGRT